MIKPTKAGPYTLPPGVIVLPMVSRGGEDCCCVRRQDWCCFAASPCLPSECSALATRCPHWPASQIYVLQNTATNWERPREFIPVRPALAGKAECRARRVSGSACKGLRSQGLSAVLPCCRLPTAGCRLPVAGCRLT